MKLYRKMKKTLVVTLVAAMATSAMPVFATDYINHWAEKAITKWSENGILAGYEDGTFRPENTITRGELAQIISGIFGLENIHGDKEYTDVAANAWYANGVAVVAAAGIMNDYEDGTFRPDQPATREEAAYAIARAYRMAAEDEEVDFVDNAQISEWAEDEVAALVSGGVIAGYPDGSFQPQGVLKRSEVVFMIDRITAELVNTKGTYSQDIEGNLVVNTADVVLKDMTVTGNLYLSEGIGEGDVTLEGVTVLGDVIVEGGGQNTIKVKGKSVLNNILVDKNGDKLVRLLLDSLVQVKGPITLMSPCIVEGNNVVLPQLIIDGAKKVELKGLLTIQEAIIQRQTELNLAKDSVLQTLLIAKTAPNTLITGKGEIKGEVTVNADGVKLDGIKLDAKKVIIGEGVTTKPIINLPTTGGNGGGGGGGGGGQNNPKVQINKFLVKLASGDTKEVKLSGAADIEVAQDKIIVEGVEFTKDDKVESILVEANTKNILISYRGLGSFKVELESGKEYTTAELVKQINDQKIKDKAIEILDTYGLTLGLTQKQVDIAKVKVGIYYDKVMDSLNTGVIDIQTLLTKAREAEIELESDEYLDNHADILALASKLNVSITGLGEGDLNPGFDIKKVETSASGITVQDKSGTNDAKDYTVNVTYHGVAK